MHWALIVLIIALPTYLVRFSIFGIPTTLFEVALYLLVIWALVSRPLAYIVEQLKPFFKRYGVAIALLLLASIISVVIAPDKRIALGIFKAYIIDSLLLSGLIILCATTKDRLKQLTQALVTSGLIVALSTLIGPSNTEGRALGLYAWLDEFASPNFIALFTAPIGVLSLALATLKGTKAHKAFYWIAFIATLVGLGLSGSRGGLMAATVGAGLVLLWWVFRKVKRQQQHLVKLLSVAFIAISIAVGWWFARPDFTENAAHRVSTSNNLRYEIWRTTVIDILPAKAFLGVGLGNYQAYFTELTKDRVNFPEYISPWARTPHNFLLTLWTNLGFLGFAAIIWALVRYFFDKEKGKALPATVFTIAMITLFIHGLVDSAYWKNDLAALFWLLISLDHANRYLGEEA